MSYVRVIYDMHKRERYRQAKEDRIAVMEEIKNKEYKTTSGKAFFPFLVLLFGFICGLPIFLVGLVSALVVMILAHKDMKSAEQTMMQGVGLIATVGCNDRLPVHEHGYQTNRSR